MPPVPGSTPLASLAPLAQSLESSRGCVANLGLLNLSCVDAATLMAVGSRLRMVSVATGGCEERSCIHSLLPALATAAPACCDLVSLHIHYYEQVQMLSLSWSLSHSLPLYPLPTHTHTPPLSLCVCVCVWLGGEWGAGFVSRSNDSRPTLPLARRTGTSMPHSVGLHDATLAEAMQPPLLESVMVNQYCGNGQDQWTSSSAAEITILVATGRTSELYSNLCIQNLCLRVWSNSVSMLSSSTISIPS